MTHTVSGSASAITPDTASTYDAVLNTPASVLSVLAGGDADDSTYNDIAQDPTLLADAFRWINVTPTTTKRYAMVRGIDSNNTTSTGWYTWAENDFEEALAASTTRMSTGSPSTRLPLHSMTPPWASSRRPIGETRGCSRPASPRR